MKFLYGSNEFWSVKFVLQKSGSNFFDWGLDIWFCYYKIKIFFLQLFFYDDGGDEYVITMESKFSWEVFNPW